MAQRWCVPGYTTVHELGSSDSGTVVHAVDEAGTAVAIKYLSPELLSDWGFWAAFRTEAQLLAQLDSPNVARLWEYVESPRGAAIVMELVEGASLRTVLADQGPTEPEAALLVLKDSLLGLGAAHAVGVVHRDYRPANVLVSTAGEAKLVGFGVVGRSGGVGGGSGMSAYLPPEQWAGGAASPGGDIYSATATFVECVSGRPPFAGSDLATLRQQHELAPVPAATLPGPLQGLALRGMSKDPDERPADAAAFLAELERAAVSGYGEDWAERGRDNLAYRAALLAPPPAAAPAAAPAVTAIDGRSRRVPTEMVLGTAAAVALVAAAGVGVLTLLGTDNGAGADAVPAIAAPRLPAALAPAELAPVVSAPAPAPAVAPAVAPAPAVVAPPPAFAVPPPVVSPAPGGVAPFVATREEDDEPRDLPSRPGDSFDDGGSGSGGDADGGSGSGGDADGGSRGGGDADGGSRGGGDADGGSRGGGDTDGGTTPGNDGNGDDSGDTNDTNGNNDRSGRTISRGGNDGGGGAGSGDNAARPDDTSSP